MTTQAADVIEHSSLQAWLLENLLQGVSRDRLVEILASRGMEGSAAEAAVIRTESQFSGPLYFAAKRLAQRTRKLECLLSVLSKLRALDPANLTVPRRQHIPYAEFLRDFYAANQPVILTDIIRSWPALTKWDLNYFRSGFGDEEIEIMDHRSSDPEYEVNMENHKVKTTFREFVTRIETAGRTNDFYLVANNFLMDDTRFSRLYSDVDCLPEYLDPNDLPGSCSLWFGPAGTATMPHHDTINVFLCQILGRKQISLIPTLDTPLVYNYRGVFSEVNWDHPDLEQYPAFREAQRLEITLNAGEVLFIPIGWWHYITALDPSISISFSNFKAPNEFWIDNPGRPDTL